MEKSDRITKNAKVVYRLANHHKGLLVLLIGLLVIAAVSAYSFSSRYANSQKTLQNAQFAEISLANQYATLSNQYSNLSIRYTDLNNSNAELSSELIDLQNAQTSTDLQGQINSLEMQNSQLTAEVTMLESELANTSKSSNSTNNSG